MTQVVTVRTDFADLNQMAQGLVGRVNETHVILPAGAPVDVGEWAQFAVTLHDGTPGFAGMGRCVTFVDNGEERQSHQRFDVVFDSLQFDPRGHQIYAHILALSGYGYDPAHEQGAAQEGAGEHAGQYDEDGAHAESADAYAYSDVPSAPAAELSAASAAEQLEDDERATFADSIPVPMNGSAAAHDDDAAEATVIASRTDLQAAMVTASSQPPPAASYGVEAVVVAAAPVVSGLVPSPAAAPAAPVSIRATPLTLDVSVHYTAEPVVDGALDYPSGLPFPAEPPRPPLGEAQRVTPAPRPR